MFTAEPLHELVGTLTSQFNRWADVALLTPSIHTFKVKVILSVAPEAAVASAYERQQHPSLWYDSQKHFQKLQMLTQRPLVW